MASDGESKPHHATSFVFTTLISKVNSMNTKRISLAVMAVFLTAAAVTPAMACFVRSPQPVQVWLDHINVEIVDQVAVKTYHCTFLNPNRRAVVGGTCYMELEPGSHVTKMSVNVNGKKGQAEVLNQRKSNQVFAEMINEGGSTALLEYYGAQLIQTKIPAIAPGGTVVVKLEYTTVLKKKNGLVRLQMLNTNPKAAMQPLKSASVRIGIKSSKALKNVYSPTHKIKLVESPKHDVVVQWGQENYLPQQPFVLYYQIADDSIGASLLTHREAGEAGHFMLMLSPTLGTGVGAVAEKDVLPKDIVFCVDTSGSMLQGDKMTQARRALEFCTTHLRPNDRFNIVDFSTSVRTMSEKGLIQATPENIARAKRYITHLAPRGGTAIDEALSISLDQLRGSDRMKMVVFATDGLPTIGERSPEVILRNVAKRNTEDVRMFVFGAGFDVNTKLLDFLAVKHRGEAEYVLPQEDIEKKIAGFYDRVGSPVLTDLTIQFDGIQVEDVFPRQVSDIFRGEQIILYGKYTGSGTHKVRITGKMADKVQTFEYAVNFPEISVDEKHGFVPRLWAGEMVDFLMDEIRDKGRPEPELVSEVTRLAKRHGIVTPFTSFLMVQDNCNKPHQSQVAEFSKRLKNPGNLLANQSYGSVAVHNAWQQSRNKKSRLASGNSTAQYLQATDGLRQEGRNTQAMAAIRFVGNRTYYKSSGVWYDSRYDQTKAKQLQRVKVGSSQYLGLLSSQPNISKQMAQGNVVVNVKGQWYQFEDKDRSS